MSEIEKWPKHLLKYKDIITEYFPGHHMFISPDKERHLVNNEDLVRYKERIEELYMRDKSQPEKLQVDIYLSLTDCSQITILPKLIGVQRIFMRRCYKITNIEILEEAEGLGMIDYSKNSTDRYGQKRYVSVSGKGFWCCEEV